MAKRKLVKQGAATLMVSLPAKWIQKHQLNKGSQVDIVEKGESLKISTQSIHEKKQANINITNLTESSIRTLITNAYRIGYDKVIITYKRREALKIIHDVVKTRLLGFEIIKCDKTTCLVENITEPSGDHFDNIFSKVWLNIHDLFDIAQNMLEGKKAEDFEEIEAKIQQFDNFCLRVKSKKDLEKKHMFHWSFHQQVIHAQRELYLMLKYVSKNKIKPDQTTIKLLLECKKVFTTLHEAYEKRDLALLEKVHELDKEVVYKHGYSALKKPGDNITRMHIISAARTFYLASSPRIGVMLAKQLQD